jgi:SM-20-related protein
VVTALNKIIDDLAKHGYVKIQVFDESMMTPLAQWVKTLPMQKANIVKGENYRGDETYWLDANRHDDFMIVQRLWTWQTILNEYYLFKTNEIESHIAHYAPGTGYGRHLDAPKKDNKRVISLVGYFNPGWRKGQGGELRLYTDNGIVDIPPFHGTGVLFLSEEIEHEVLETKMDRWSVAAWFRK